MNPPAPAVILDLDPTIRRKTNEMTIREHNTFRLAVCHDRYRPATLMDLVALLTCGHIDHLCGCGNPREGTRMKKIIVHKSGTVSLHGTASAKHHS
jgi:hypothetical protein